MSFSELELKRIDRTVTELAAYGLVPGHEHPRAQCEENLGSRGRSERDDGLTPGTLANGSAFLEERVEDGLVLFDIAGG